jgi:hypothetical protein
MLAPIAAHVLMFARQRQSILHKFPAQQQVYGRISVECARFFPDFDGYFPFSTTAPSINKAFRGMSVM